jgi:hypothetical protein
VICIAVPVHRVSWLGVFVKLIVHVCAVTVAFAVALTASLFVGPVEPLAVPMFVVVAVITADFVSVAQALGANGPHEPIDPR